MHHSVRFRQLSQRADCRALNAWRNPVPSSCYAQNFLPMDQILYLLIAERDKLNLSRPFRGLRSGGAVRPRIRWRLLLRR
jgi:hypothetical protein